MKITINSNDKAVKTVNANGTFKLEVITKDGEVILIARAAKKVWKYLSIYTSDIYTHTKYEKSNVLRVADSFKSWTMQEQLTFE